jgi:hypothetical protein
MDVFVHAGVAAAAEAALRGAFAQHPPLGFDAVAVTLCFAFYHNAVRIVVAGIFQQRHRHRLRQGCDFVGGEMDGGTQAALGIEVVDIPGNFRNQWLHILHLCIFFLFLWRFLIETSCKTVYNTIIVTGREKASLFRIMIEF